VTTGGAESQVYAQKTPAYKAKNGPFESIEELALVSGATRELLYGEDANLNGALDATEDDGATNAPDDNGDGKLDAGLLAYVTVFSREPNKQADDTDRININRPGPNEPLNTLLTTKFGESRAGEIRASLGPGPFPSTLVFFVRSAMKEDEFAQILDALTTATGDYRTGLINVNTASAAVLAGVPGIGAEKAAKLVTARLSRTVRDTNIAWVVAALGDPAAVAQAGPFLTGQSWQVMADVAAVGRHGRGYRRTKFVIDHSTGTARIIYRRNLAPLGWALGSEVRQTLAERKDTR